MDWMFSFVFARPAWIPYAIAMWIVFLVLALVSYRGSAMAFWQRGLGVSLRMLGIGILLFCLLEPIGSMERPKPQSNSVAVLVDNSRSMRALLQPVGADDTAIASSPVSWLQDDADWVLDLSRDFRVRKYLFDQSLSPTETFADWNGTGHASTLDQSLKLIQDRYRGQPLAAIVLVSDGQSTEDAAIAEQGAAGEVGHDVPIFPIRLSGLAAQSDVRLDRVGIRESEFETAPVSLTAVVSQDGFDGQNAIVELRDATDRIVQQERLVLGKAREPKTVEFRVRPDKSGIVEYSVLVRLEEEPGWRRNESGPVVMESTSRREWTYGNNRRFALVDRGIGPYRILYLAGRPNWEFKFLRRALDEDAEIELTALIRIARKEPKFSFRDSKLESTNPLFSGFEDVSDEEKQQYDEPVFARLGVKQSGELQKGFPKDAEELFQYSAVVIDDLEHDFLTLDQQQLLRQFVSIRGGALLVLGGQESMRGKGFRDSVLGQLLPVYGDMSPVEMETQQGGGVSDGSRIRYQLTREGWLQPYLRLFSQEAEDRARMAAMPAFDVWNRTSQIKPGASVLVEGVVDGEAKSVPLLLAQRFGKGRAGAFMLGDFWKWGLMHEGDTTSPVFQSWRQIVRAMIADVPSPIQLRMEVDPGTGRQCRLVSEVRGEDFQVVENAKVMLQISTPSGESMTAMSDPSAVRAGEYVTELLLTESGPYRVEAEVFAVDGSRLGTAASGWVHEPEVKELARLGIDESRLDQLATQSGARRLTVDQLGGLSAFLPVDRIPIKEVRTYPLWHQPWIVLGALLSLILEWWTRRSHGLA
jgi:uncharacterized membrane protein